MPTLRCRLRMTNCCRRMTGCCLTVQLHSQPHRPHLSIAETAEMKGATATSCSPPPAHLRQVCMLTNRWTGMQREGHLCLTVYLQPTASWAVHVPRGCCQHRTLQQQVRSSIIAWRRWVAQLSLLPRILLSRMDEHSLCTARVAAVCSPVTPLTCLPLAAGHDSGSCSVGSGMQHEEAKESAASHQPPTHRLDASSDVSPDGAATSQLHTQAPAEAALDTIASSVAQCSDGPPSPPPGPATPPQGPLLDTLTQLPLHVIQPTSLAASAANRASQVGEPLPAFQHEDTLVEAITGIAAAQAAHVPAVRSSSGQAMEPAAPATSLSTPSVSGPHQAPASAGWDQEVVQACTATDPLPPSPEAPSQQDLLLQTPVAQLRQQQQGSSPPSGSGSMAPSAELLQMAPVQHRPDEQQQTGTGTPRTPIPPTLPVQPKSLETSFDEEEQEMRMADTCRHLQGMAHEAVQDSADTDAADTGCPTAPPPAQQPPDCNCSSGLTDGVVLHGASARLSVSAIAVSNVVQGSHSSSTTAAATTTASLEGAQSEEQVPHNQVRTCMGRRSIKG